jgi:hypothetical protein
LKCLNICMVHHFLMLCKIFELKKIFINRREKICGTSYLNLENI